MKVLIVISAFTSILQAKTINVLSIDTGVDLSHPEIRSHINMGEWSKPEYQDTNDHGTHIAGLILRDTCPEVELTSCKYFYEKNSDLQNMENVIKCFKFALLKHFDVINFSSGGYIFNKDEFEAIKQIKHTILVMAAGNNNKDLSIYHYYPASYDLKNIVPVGNLNGIYKAPTSNYGLKNMVWEKGTHVLSTFPGGRYGYMTGTSQSAAIRTNRILRGLCEKK